MQAHYLEFIVAGLGMFILLWEAFAAPKDKSILGLVGAAGLGLILVALFMITPIDRVDNASEAGSLWMKNNQWIANFYQHTAHAMTYKVIAVVSTILVLLLSVDFKSILNRFTCADRTDANAGEFYALPLFACAGMMWMASATDLVSIFVALELVTITFYVMVAFLRRNVGSLEAGVKYLILGALSTGILVYGIAWLYGALGTTNIAAMSEVLASGKYNLTHLLFGLALIIISLGFKVGAVPMQLWIPDVYQGAPTPITAFLSVASKAAGFAIAITILEPFLAHKATQPAVVTILVLMAAATLIYGNFAAIAQTNFKRLLAYSSIAHAGFLVLGLAAGQSGVVTFYLITYLIMTFAAFYIMNAVRIARDSEEISALNGLNKTNPVLAAMLTIVTAAMAGIPLTAGFWGKLFVFNAAIKSDAISWAPVIVAFLGVAAGFYYYFKIIRAMYWYLPETDEKVMVSPISKMVILVLTAAIVVFGFYPHPLQGLL